MQPTQHSPGVVHQHSTPGIGPPLSGGGTGTGMNDLDGFERDGADRFEAQPAYRGTGSDERPDEPVGWFGQYFRRCVVLHQAGPLGQHGNAVAEFDRLTDVMGDEHNGLADLGLQVQKLVL